jgi:hypothetical protein
MTAYPPAPIDCRAGANVAFGGMCRHCCHPRRRSCSTAIECDGTAEILGHSQTKGRANRGNKLRPKPARQSSTLPMRGCGNARGVRSPSRDDGFLQMGRSCPDYGSALGAFRTTVLRSGPSEAIRFRPPPRRTQRADFPHCAPPFASPQGLWDLACWGSFQPHLAAAAGAFGRV